MRIAALLLLLGLGACAAGPTQPVTAIPASPIPVETTVVPIPTETPALPSSPTDGMTLIFAEEFERTGLDTSIWNTSYRWGRTNNNEAQYYAEDALAFRDSLLRIRAEQTYRKGKSYTSGIITSYEKFAFTYGYAEMRARLPAGQGLWPAFWLLTVREPEGKIDEIDVFELLGHQPTILHMTMHWSNALGRDQQESHIFDGPDFSRDFHVFAVDWQPAQVVWYVDGIERARVNHDVPSDPMYLIANLAVGGTWPGLPDATTRFPAFYEIDYIRVYQRP